MILSSLSGLEEPVCSGLEFPIAGGRTGTPSHAAALSANGYCFTIAVLLIVFLMATAIGFACTGFSRR